MWKEICIVVFITVTGVNWVCHQILTENRVSATDASFNLFVEVLGIGLTVLALDRIWFAEERKRWRRISDKVQDLLSDELSAIFSDLSLILISPKVFSIEAETPEQEIKEIQQKTEEYQMSELERLASGDLEDVKQLLVKEKNLLEGKYGRLFEKRSDNLSDIELKYGKFLEPEKLRLVIDLERLLKSLHGNIATRLKLLKRGYGGPFVSAIDEKIFHKVHEILRVLNESRNMRLKYF